MKEIADVFTFMRYEKKYLITAAEKDELLAEIGEFLIPDTHGRSTICSLYLDTDDFLLIRNSIDAKVYKEKLRLRSYGTPSRDDKVFLEIKKKYKGVVYKRRISLTLEQAENYINNGIRPEESQIMREIDYAMRLYKHPVPRMLIAYDRDAYYVKDMPHLRLTFDTNLRYRNGSLYLEHGSDGSSLLPEGKYIFELKTDGAMPLWLSHALDKLKILPASFSKYGTAYRRTYLNENFEDTLQNDTKGINEHALSL